MMSDLDARQAALDIGRSFSVAAPAGSGKTGLLTQRMLRLLAHCEQPEQVLCMTFTRKAAGEMRRRILEALRSAAEDQSPEDPFQRQTWALAREAAARDRAAGWRLTETANRLQIHTIDAFCMQLARRLAGEAGTAGLDPSEDAEPFYRAAVRELCAQLEAPGATGEALAALLLHLDDHLPRLEALLIRLLGRREQWLRQLLTSRDERAVLEAALDRLIADTLGALRAAFTGVPGDLPGLLGYAAANRTAQGEATALDPAADGLPGTDGSALPAWREILSIFLTKDGNPRKKIDRRQGFPVAKDSVDPAGAELWKASWAELRDQLSTHPELLSLADDTLALPHTGLTDSQWQVLDCLARLLPELAARLDLVFRRHGRCDFTAVTLAALRALGEDQAPSDLALRLDRNLCHILVDECQDTSGLQFDLLLRLTAGWQEGDGRTLFLVGDGMQSLYGFRDANVGLFLDSRRHPLGAIRLRSLDLNVNFRSQERLVGWFNRIFRDAFPAREDPGRGAVPYTPAVAVRPPHPGAAVRIDALDPLTPDDALGEQVAACAERALAEPGSVAILVRSRPHLQTILPALRRRGLHWQATDIDRLGDRMAVIDLLSLTRALLCPADRVAWLAVLRAPWSGLQHADLLALAGGSAGDLRDPLLPRLAGWADNPGLSDEARAILARIAPILSEAWAGRERKPLRSRIEGAWIALGGPAALLDLGDQRLCRQYFELLEREAACARDDWPTFARRVHEGYAAPAVTATTDARLQILTMHKAKGLEFDTVILPALDRPGRSEDPELLLWRERVTANGRRDLLISPPQRSGDARDPLYAWLAREAGLARQLENTRTLYVACTRAVRRLHLVFRLPGPGGPAKSSLLARIWPTLAPELDHPGDDTEITLHPPDPATAQPTEAILRHGVRLPPAWRPSWPEVPRTAPAPTPAESDPADGDPLARLAGTLFHRSVRQLLSEGAAHWNAARIDRQQRVWQAELAAAGFDPEPARHAVARIRRALENLLNDDHGRWLIAEHAGGGAELELGYQAADGQVRTAIVDRTFIAAGVRWIIDYKLAEPQRESRDAFLARQGCRYRTQLEGYAALFRHRGSEPVRTALYFPLLPHLEVYAAEALPPIPGGDKFPGQ